MKYYPLIFFAMLLCSCPPQVLEEKTIRSYFEAIENGDTKWLEKHTDKDFKYVISYLMTKDKYFSRPLEKHNFLSRNRSQNRFKITVYQIKQEVGCFKVIASKSQEVQLFIPFEAENKPNNRYALPFEYTFTFKDMNTIGRVAVDTLPIQSEYLFSRWSNYINSVHHVDASVNSDSLKIEFEKTSKNLYSYVLHATNGWH